MRSGNFFFIFDGYNGSIFYAYGNAANLTDISAGLLYEWFYFLQMGKTIPI